MAYQYDVFISYKSGSRKWLQKAFLPAFQHHLENKVGLGVRIFVDWHDIRTGNIWELSLKRGLASSKCLVSLLMPTYFESEWCKREFAVFEHRGKQCGFMTIENDRSLIIPVVLDRGRAFPRAVTRFQADFDFVKYYVPNIEGFERRKKYQRLQEDIRLLTDRVADTLLNAPDWDPSWQNDDWLELPTDHLEIENFTVSRFTL